jgi:hypothetical protein
MLGMGVVSTGIYGWISLGLFIVGGSGLAHMVGHRADMGEVLLV